MEVDDPGESPKIPRRSVLLGAVATIGAVAVGCGSEPPSAQPSSSPKPNAGPQLRVRRSITELQDQYTLGNKKPLEDLWRAWIGVKNLPPDDPRSFFMLAGYHGEPFRGTGATDPHFWGGYCQHGNVLFPTFHRLYLLRLEDALRSIPGCQDVALPFWDETSEQSITTGIPWALTRQTVELDGKTIPNPLRSFIFNADIVDNVEKHNPVYSKPKGYETVRFPLSGLVGTPDAVAATSAHNAQYPDYDHNVAVLNENVTTWLAGVVVIDGKPTRKGQVVDKYRRCLDAPNYTVFSNKASAAQWNDDVSHSNHPGPLVESLEQPHNSIHLAIGGFDVPGNRLSTIEGANGDMGENETAAFDPIFYFHHCFVDRVFWLWQLRHGATDKLDIIPGYKGTSSSDSQGPTPDMAPNTPLDMITPLHPFTKPDGTMYTSADCANIEAKLGYTYGPGSLLDLPAPEASGPPPNSRIIAVSGINPANIRGSFLISVFGTTGGERVHLGTEAVLSHWDVGECANCADLQAFFEVPPAKAGFMPSATDATLSEKSSYVVEVHSHDRVIHPSNEPVNTMMPGSPPPQDNGQPDFHFDVR
jgi:tyrosinase